MAIIITLISALMLLFAYKQFSERRKYQDAIYLNNLKKVIEFQNGE